MNETKATTAPPLRRYVPAIGPRLKILLSAIFALFAILGVNSVYLAGITFLEWFSGQTYQNYFYQYMFLLHLGVGFLIVVPVIVFGIAHISNAHNRPNRRAVRAGYALFATVLIVLASGVVLTRLEGVIVVKDPAVRGVAYWVHVLGPLVAVWLFILHRLAGRRIKWKVGATWLGAATAFALIMTVLHSQDPRKWSQVGPASGEKYFFPSLARTATGNFIPSQALLNDHYCIKCHQDAHATWSNSVHKFSSFNNPPYLFSVLQTRKALYERDGHARGSRFCAGCHDPVPFFSGAFDDPKYDDPNYDLAGDALAQAGVTCSVCHAITNINSPRGNSDYTIEQPVHYPFAYSDNTFLQWINNQLVKAKPEFHKKTFLKPLHKSPEFCGACHKVHLPQELNAYKWLRGQNHYDSYHLSGVSGHGIRSFYYPETAEHNCNGCHMPLLASDDFGAQLFDDSGVLKVHNHQFPSANTAIPHLLGLPQAAIQAHEDFLEGVLRVDIFGIKKGGTIDGKLTAPIGPRVPTLKPGQSYLLETVIRTLKMGHLFTEGTADSNEVWMDVIVANGDRIIGRSGGLSNGDREVDPYSHFVNAFVIDREGNRIDRRNVQDIFIALYNHQIPPGAADVVHYLLTVPDDATGSITVEVKLQFRKFDARYVKFFENNPDHVNDLPIVTLAVDRVTFPITDKELSKQDTVEEVEPWQRWNDYGIGLLRKGQTGSSKGELRQAEHAFKRVWLLNRADGLLNLARVYIKDGRLREAAVELRHAAQWKPPAPPWSIAWFSGIVNKQNGHLDDAIANFTAAVEMKDTELCRRREFDFSQDYVLLNELGQTLFERAKQERGAARRAAREELLRAAVGWFERSLELDPENVTAHYNLFLLFAHLGDDARAEKHRSLHAKYKPDDNARDHAVAAARIKYPAANLAAEAVVIYDLHRRGAYGLPGPSASIARTDGGSNAKASEIDLD